MLTQQKNGATHRVKATFFSLFADVHPMDTEDESDNSILREITTMAPRRSANPSPDALSLTSIPQISPEVEIVLRDLRSELDELKKARGNQATEGEEGMAQQGRAALVLRSVDVSENNKEVKVAMDE